MTEPGVHARHLTRDGLADYLAAGAPAVIKIDGAPILYLVIEPALRRLALRTPLARQSLPDLTTYRHVSAVMIHWNDRQWFELRVEGQMLLDAYPVLCSIADRIQLQHVDVGPAVADALASLRELLASYGRLSEEQEIGLFGELLVLRHLIAERSISEPIQSWRGSTSEEHDFDIGVDDVEVKSTTSECRHHWIGDLHQLKPTVGRRLWLVSIQLTGAGSGGSSLPELVDAIRLGMSAGPSADEMRRKLDASGWRDETSPLYTRRFRLRSSPAVFEVDKAFPALTPSTLAAAGVDHERIVRVKYVINLDGLPSAASPPEPLRGIGSGERNDRQTG